MRFAGLTLTFPMMLLITSCSLFIPRWWWQTLTFIPFYRCDPNLIYGDWYYDLFGDVVPLPTVFDIDVVIDIR